MKQYFFILNQTFLRFKAKSSRKDSDTVRWRQMHLSSSGNIAIVGSFLLFQSLLSDYFGKKKVSSSTTCPATRLPKMDNNHRSNNYFFNDLWCQRKKDKEVKKSFVLACIALFQYNLVPLFLKVPDQIDHSSATPQEVKYSARSRNHLITVHWVLITFMRPFQIAVVRVLLGINNRQRCLPQLTYKERHPSRQRLFSRKQFMFGDHLHH